MIRRLWGNVSYQDPARFFGEISKNFMQLRDLSQVQSTPQASPRTLAQTSYPRPSSLSGGASLQQDLIGRRLQHPEYGQGTVIFTEGSGEEKKVTVEFGGKQRRKFLYRYVSGYVQ